MVAGRRATAPTGAVSGTRIIEHRRAGLSWAKVADKLNANGALIGAPRRAGVRA